MISCFYAVKNIVFGVIFVLRDRCLKEKKDVKIYEFLILCARERGKNLPVELSRHFLWRSFPGPEIVPRNLPAQPWKRQLRPGLVEADRLIFVQTWADIIRWSRRDAAKGNTNVTTLLLMVLRNDVLPKTKIGKIYKHLRGRQSSRHDLTMAK